MMCYYLNVHFQVQRVKHKTTTVHSGVGDISTHSCPRR